MLIFININILGIFGFDTHRFLLDPSSGTGRNVISFGVDIN